MLLPHLMQYFYLFSRCLFDFHSDRLLSFFPFQLSVFLFLLVLFWFFGRLVRRG